MKILVTGAAGYVGLHLVDRLLKSGYKVRAVDNFFTSSPENLLKFVEFAPSHFEFVNADITSESDCLKIVDGVDCVVNLAALVGEGICKKMERLAEITNAEAVGYLCESTNVPIIHASTGSVYGEIIGQKCTETIKCEPVSWYGTTKLWAESCLQNRGKAVALRFATGCGLSPKLRNDLLVNNLVYNAVNNGVLAIYQADFMRTFISVKDMARAFHFFVDKVARCELDNEYHVFNVGDESLNLSKRDLAEFIAKKTRCLLTYPEGGYVDGDKRNYEVDYSEIRKAGFTVLYGLESIVDELISGFKILKR